MQWSGEVMYVLIGCLYQIGDFSTGGRINDHIVCLTQ